MSNSSRKIKKNLRRFNLISFPDPILQVPTQKVPDSFIGTDDYYSLVDKMRSTNKAEKGLGIAAPQVGSKWNMFYYKIGNDEGVVTNPVIVDHNDNYVPYQEGCLSIKGYYWDVMRPEQITVQFLDHHGQLREAVVDELAARVFQHEIDHLNGILIIDHLTDEQYDKFEHEFFELGKSGVQSVPQFIQLKGK